MTDLTAYAFEGQRVRPATLESGEPGLVLADAARILGYRDAANAARILREHHKGYAEVSTPGGVQRMLAVTEQGLNRLVLKSNASNAEAVQDWLTDEVLPALRRTGTYSTPRRDVAVMSAREVLVLAQRLVVAEDERDAARARAERSEATVDAIEASNGITITQFHKHYFSEVAAREFFEFLYSLRLLIDQRGARGRNEKGRLKDGHQHRHPAAAGKPYFYLHGRLDSEGVRREDTRVRPGRPEVDLVLLLASKGLTANANALTAAATPKEIAA